MNTTVSDLIAELQRVEKLHGDKPITIVCPNGLRVFPQISVKRVVDFDFTSEIEEIVLTWE